MSALRTGGAGFCTYCRSAGGPLGLAKLAPLRIVPELLVVKEKLFPRGEYKLIPAIHTFENLVDELHLLSPAGLPRYRSAGSEPHIHRHSESELLIVANFFGELSLKDDLKAKGPGRGEERRLPGA
jgi:hypothetical protein